MKRDKFGKYENSCCIRSSRYEIIIAFISLDGTWQVNRWMIEQDKVVLKEACINYRARFWCTRDDRLVDTLGTHFLPCAASRTFVPRIIPTPLGVWHFLTPNNWIPTSGRRKLVTRWNSSDIERDGERAINR